MTYVVMAYVVMAYVVMAHIVVAYVVMAYIVMAHELNEGFVASKAAESRVFLSAIDEGVGNLKIENGPWTCVRTCVRTCVQACVQTCV